MNVSINSDNEVFFAILVITAIMTCYPASISYPHMYLLHLFQVYSLVHAAFLSVNTLSFLQF